MNTEGHREQVRGMKSADEDGKGEGGISATLGAAAGGPGLPTGAFAPLP